jgi:hypothetical protein
MIALRCKGERIIAKEKFEKEMAIFGFSALN